jgi:chemotaxis protein MotB
MAKRERAEPQKPNQGWLVTFGDLVTLLLTFFVLLLTMASMDRNYISSISMFSKNLGFMTYKSSGKVPDRVKFIIERLERPEDLLLDRQRIKDLLFPDEVLPSGIDRSTLDENLDILERDEGVALVLSDKLLFPSGGWELSPAARELLAQVALVLKYMTPPVNVAGFADSTPSRTIDNYTLSGNRALAVLDCFLQEEKLEPARFTASAYGPELPLADNATEAGRAKNRRVEILVKTREPLGSYP